MCSLSDGKCLRTLYCIDRHIHYSSFSPSGIAYDEIEDVLYVCDMYSGRIVVLNAENGSLIRKWGSIGNKDYEFRQPYHIAFHSKLRLLFITDCMNNRVKVFTPNGEYVTTFGDRSLYFFCPSGIAIDEQNNKIYVAANRITVFQLHTNGDNSITVTFDRWVLAEDNPNGQLKEPLGVCLSEDNTHLYVCDGRCNHVQVLNVNTGECVAVLGRTGYNDGQFLHPTGVCVVGHRVYVCQGQGVNIQVFE
jgi:DNA-binding beta-propeller fold protein YncE